MLLSRRISESALISSVSGESKSSILRLRRACRNDASIGTPSAASAPSAWCSCVRPDLCILFVATAAQPRPRRMSSIVPHMLPRGPTSRNILYPSSAILRTVSSNFTSPAHASAISSRRWRTLPGSIGFAVAQE